MRGRVGARAGSHWRIAPFRPGVSPIHNLALALAVPDVLGGDGTDPLMAAAPLEATLRRSAFGLADAVRSEVVTSAVPGHGVVLLAEPEIRDAVVDWLRERVT